MITIFLHCSSLNSTEKMADDLKRAADDSTTNAEEDDWVGPLPEDAVKTKKRNVRIHLLTSRFLPVSSWVSSAGPQPAFILQQAPHQGLPSHLSINLGISVRFLRTSVLYPFHLISHFRQLQSYTGLFFFNVFP